MRKCTVVWAGSALLDCDTRPPLAGLELRTMTKWEAHVLQTHKYWSKENVNTYISFPYTHLMPDTHYKKVTIIFYEDVKACKYCSMQH